MSAANIGRTFGDFVIRAHIGAGGAGDVYRAEQLTLGREAVIKVLRRHDGLSLQAAERFLREARLASRLDHPFAAHVYAFGVETDGTLWIALELVRGTPLDKLVVAQGPIALPRFVPLFERLCEVLNAAHEQGIVHRDIKPANVMVLQRAGRLLPKLLDLGIARASAAGGDGQPAKTAEAVASLDQATGELPSETGTLSSSWAAGLTRSESMQLTQAGAVVGTPHYMAPEQWLDPAGAGPRADVYSLAILAYQCLTGRLPFEGTTLKALARAHATKALPPLGEGLPEPLLAVLQQGAAKKEEARFESPLAFAAALRAASGIGLEPPPLPQLDEGLRENILSEGPQPLAEAVAMMDAARTPRRAVEATGVVARVLCRYLGVLALTARARVGAGAAQDSADVIALLTQLRDSGLSDVEWLKLSRGLLKPFDTRREAHLFPELVAFFAEGDAGSGSRLLEEVLSLPPAQEAGEEAAVRHLLHVVPRLGAVLERASFIFDYSLAVQRGDVQRWMGTRRPHRLPQHVATRPAPGEVVLVDAEGTPTSLAPLVQCVAPSGGADAELFFLEGPGRHGARLVAWPSPYERQDETLWDWLVQHRILPPKEGPQETDETRPYLGLSTFSPADADNYFGREKQAEAFANRLRGEDFLAVVGPSGTGKSSFILAGVLPLLPQDWRPLVLRPGATPLTALRARLESEGLPALSAGPDALAQHLGDATLLLVVDQFEELVTLCQDGGARLEFATTLLNLARHPSGRVKLVVTLRDDFLIKVEQLAPFRDTLSNSLQLLGTPAPEDLQRVVTEPARRAGYSFDDATLPSRMVESVAEYPGALALLSFTSSQLWDLRDRHLRLMRVKTYDALGGVGGALANHAEATLAALTEAEQRLVRELFRHLVTAQGTRAVMSRKETLEVLGGGALAQSVLEKLVSARLLVSSETASGDDSIEVIHEALITAWPRLVGWQRQDAESARMRDALRAAARQWEERGRAAGLLWRKEVLAEYRLWRARFPGGLTHLEEAFAEASLRDEARGRLLRRALGSAAFVVLLVGLVLIFRAYREADSSSKEATLRLQSLWQERGRLALIAGRPDEALIFSANARHLGASSEPLAYVIAAAAQQLQGLERVEVKTEIGRSLVISPEHRLAAVLTGTELVVMDLAQHRLSFRVPMRSPLVTIDPNTADLLLPTMDDTVVRYSREGTLLKTYPSAAYSLHPEADGGVLAASAGTLANLEANSDSVIARKNSPTLAYTQASDGLGVLYFGLWSAFDSRCYFRAAFLRGGVEIFETEAFETPVRKVAVVAGLPLVALGRFDGHVTVYDVERRQKKWDVKAHRSVVTSLAISVRERLVISMSKSDRAIKGFDLDSGEERFNSSDWTGIPTCLALSESLGLVAVGLSDGPLHLLDTETGQSRWVHHGHSGSIVGCGFWGEQVSSLGEDGSLRTWSTKLRRTSKLDGVWDREVGPFEFDVLVDGGSRVAGTPAPPMENAVMSARAPVWAKVTGDTFERVVWDGGYEVTARAPLSSLVDAVTITPFGDVLVAHLEDGTVLHLRGDGGTLHSFKQGQDVAQSGEFSSDGGLWITGSQSGVLKVWDPSTGQLLKSQKAHSSFFVVRSTELDDVFLTFGYDRTIKEWRFTGTEFLLLRALQGLPDTPRAVSFLTPSLVWIGYKSGSFDVYDFQKGERLNSVALGLPPAQLVKVLRDKMLFVSKRRTEAAALVEWPPSPSDATLEQLLRCRLGTRPDGGREAPDVDCR